MEHRNILLLWVTVCAVAGDTTLLDMTHNFSNDTDTWPGMGHWHFEFQKVFSGQISSFWISWNQFRMGEHIGTHMDAPSHFLEGGMTLDQIPVEHFIAPVAVIDLRERVKTNKDAMVLQEDLVAWEEEHGPLPLGAVVLMCSGWDLFWGDRAKFFGNDREDSSDFHFPGFHQDAVQYLVDKQGVGIGVDTVSLDPGSDRNRGAHIVMSNNQLYGLENVKNICLLPPVGATLYSFPIKLKGGSGGPARVLAAIDGAPGKGKGKGKAHVRVKRQASSFISRLTAWKRHL